MIEENNDNVSKEVKKSGKFEKILNFFKRKKEAPASADTDDVDSKQQVDSENAAENVEAKSRFKRPIVLVIVVVLIVVLAASTIYWADLSHKCSEEISKLQDEIDLYKRGIGWKD